MNLNPNSRTVLVTGGAGYVGARLVPELVDAGYTVHVLDTCWYGSDFFDHLKGTPKFKLFEGDLRDRETVRSAVNGCTDVIHLACISNDPSYDLDPDLGREVNFEAFEPLIEESKRAGVSRFIYASSSSVYGVKEEEQVTEQLALEPLTDYSKYKALCEPILLDAASDDFVVTILRPATLCGYSPRQRLDLTVNMLTNHAYNNGVIRVFGGAQYRPNLHIDDMCRAYRHVLAEDPARIQGRTYNVGWENRTVRDIADAVASHFGDDIELSIEPTNDDRSYRVSSDLIRQELGFAPVKTIDDAIADLKQAFDAGLLPDSMSESKYFNIKRMNDILAG